MRPDWKLPPTEIMSILRKWSVPEDLIEAFGIAREQAIALAAQKKLFKWIEERKIFALVPNPACICIMMEDWQALCKELGVK